MKVILDGVEYDAVKPDDVTIADLLALKSATGLSRAELNKVVENVQALSEEEQQHSDEGLLLAGISVWFARRHAGERLTLEEACDISPSKVEFRAEPGDPQSVAAPGSGLDPTRQASARGAARGPQDRKPKKTSARKSSSA